MLVDVSDLRDKSCLMTLIARLKAGRYLYRALTCLKPKRSEIVNNGPKSVPANQPKAK